MTRETDPTPKAVVVPVEPTEAMLDAMFAAYAGSEGSYRESWRAALSAAPQASLPPVEEVREAVAAIIDPLAAELREELARTATLIGDDRPPQKLVDDATEHGRVKWDAALTKADAILAALSPVPSGGGEPVAWRWQQFSTVHGAWIFRLTDDRPTEGPRVRNIRPLFDHAAPVPAVEAGWRSMESAPKDGSKIIVIDKYDSAETVWWDATEYVGTARGWVTTKGFPIDRVESAFIGWTSAPGEPLPDEGLRSDMERMQAALIEAEYHVGNPSAWQEYSEEGSEILRSLIATIRAALGEA